MKIVISLLFIFLSTVSMAKDVVIGISPYQESAMLQQQVKQSLQYALSLDTGDTVYIVDAYHIKPLATFVVPEGKAYSSPKARLKANKKAVPRLMAFAKNPPQTLPSPSVGAALRMPQFLRHVAQNFAGEENVDVLVFGSPLYDDPTDAAFSMEGAIIPNDAHLHASRDKSVYGIKGYDQALNNIRLHWAYGDKAVFPSDQHSFLIERFWQLYVTQQSGQFVTFVPFANTVFERVKKSASALSNPHQLEQLERLEMIRLQNVEVETSIHERPLSSIKPTVQQLRQAQYVEVGITWRCEQCDLDLYVRPQPKAATLFYGHTRSSYGVMFKDFLGSPMGNGGFETIALSVPVDLRAMAIAINFYKGESEDGVSGQIRLSMNGHTYGMPFTIQAAQGNKGKQAKQSIARNKSLSSHTLLIDPLILVSL